MKTQVMSIKDFMNYEKEPFSVKVERHLKKYGKIYKVAGLTLIVFSTANVAFASELGIEPAARQLYHQLVRIGKWIIIFKGGFDTIKNIGIGDFEAAKKNFFAYLLTYLFLIALPYGMDQVEKIGISASGQ
jgi:hypothetical protein